MKKNKLIRFVCLFVILSFTTLFFSQINMGTDVVEAKTVSQLEKDIEAAKQKQKELQSQIDKTKNNISKEKENQTAINNKIAVTQEQINNLSTQINNLDADITKTEGNIKTQEDEIVKGVEDFKQRIRAMYLAGNESYAEILTGSGDFFELLMKYRLVKDITKHDKDALDTLVKQKQALENQKSQLETDKKKIESAKATLDSNKKDLDTLYSQSNDTIATQQAEQKKYENASAEQQKQIEQAQRDMDKIYEDLKNQSSSTNSQYVGGTFTWPLPGYSYISSKYGNRIIGGKSNFHTGVDITGGNVYGKPIVAANSGKVIKVGFSAGGYGNYLILDHGGSYSTLYGHCSAIVVSEGQSVTKGQTIAKVGSTGWSTGPHLHFEIRINGKHQNPMNWFTSK